MTVIENFAELSEQEQREFATKLLNTINSEHIFSSDTDFVLERVEADDYSGGLWIEVNNTDTIEVSRKATWSAADDEDAYSTPDEADYDESIYTDAKSAFKTLKTVLEGYNVSLEIDDIDEDEITEVEVDSITDEDGGIGHYEFWGEIGYDSHPYVEVEGTLLVACNCALTFFVEPVDAVSDPIPEEAEEEI